MDDGRRQLRYLDPAVAAVLAVAYAVELAVAGPPVPDEIPVAADTATLVAVGAGYALIASLVIRRGHPIVPLAVALVASAASLTGPLEGSVSVLASVAVATYSAATHTRGPSALLALAAVGGLVALALLRPLDPVESSTDLAALAFVLAGPWLGGFAIRERRDREAALERRAVEAERDREARAAAAVAQERARIARELHDVVAHAISVIVLQARGARRALTADPDEARAALNAIDAVGSDALAEMRRLVGLARSSDEPASMAPRPGLGSLDALVEQVRGAGLRVDTEIVGTPRELPPGVDLAAYRIVQEALTNSLAHASPARAWITVKYGEDDLRLEIVDSGPGPAGPVEDGYGLTGMRERARLYAGSIETGPHDGGGFLVRVVLPLREAAG